MKIATAVLALVARQELTRRKAGCLLFLSVYLISGCAVLNNRVNFYQVQTAPADQLSANTQVTECGDRGTVQARSLTAREE